jgi:hypothetical protein
MIFWAIKYDSKVSKSVSAESSLKHMNMMVSSGLAEGRRNVHILATDRSFFVVLLSRRLALVPPRDSASSLSESGHAVANVPRPSCHVDQVYIDQSDLFQGFFRPSHALVQDSVARILARAAQHIAPVLQVCPADVRHDASRE